MHTDYSNKSQINVCPSQKVHATNIDCGKLKSKQTKDYYNTRRSKQTSYHVMNKNITPSTILMVCRRKRDTIRGIPKLRLLGILEYYIGVPWESPILGSSRYLFYQPSWSHPKLENFVGEPSMQFQKNSYDHARSIQEMHSNERGRVYPHTLIDRKRKRLVNAVDVVERLHDPTDPSTERTTPPSSAHV